METRELRYFVAVAEELHFGRAAERLGIAQPPLSRAIRQLEVRLGATLLERGGRTVSLTPAGAVLLDEGRTALAAVDAAEARVRRMALGEDRVVLAIKAGASGGLLSRLLDAYAAEPGAVDVDVTLCGTGEQEHLLRTGQADVAILHRPYDDTAGLAAEVIVTENQVAILPAGHPLAAREHLLGADLADLPLPRWPRPDGSVPEGPGPEVHDHAQLQALIALGRAHWVAPESSRELLRRDLAAVPILDAPRVTTVIAWPLSRPSPHVELLVRTAVTLREALAASASSPL